MSHSKVNLVALRARAEEAIARGLASRLDTPVVAGQGDVTQLVEELRVYQAELELQNEELIQAQGKIAGALERYRLLFDHLPLPALVVDGLGFIVEANRQTEELLGLSRPRSLRGGSVFQLFDFDSRARLRPFVHRRVPPPPGGLSFLSVKRGADQSLPCDVHVMSLQAASSLEETSLLVLVDRSADLALWESEQAWRSLADSSTALIRITDREQRCVYVNQAWRALTGWAPEADGGGDWLACLHPDDRGRCQAESPRREAQAEPFSLDYRLRDRDGDYRWFRDSATPRQDSAGRFIGHIHQCLDITDRVEIETNLRAARHAAEAANRAKDAFLANLGHEIRTPLNAVLGLCQALLGDALTDRQHHYLTQIHTSATALFALLTDLLAFSKLMETGEARRAPQPLRPRDLVANVATRFAPQARDQRLTLEVALDPALPPLLRGDPEGLQKILDHLVGNAVKFTASGGVRVAVDLDPLDAAQDAAAGADQTCWVRFRVSDTGIGLSPEQQGEIFTPFHQADMSLTRRHGGTGLGLGLSKRLVELMGGRIGVASSPGAGSTFWFSVPLGRPADLTKNQPENPPEAPAASGHGVSPAVTGEGANGATTGCGGNLATTGYGSGPMAPGEEVGLAVSAAEGQARAPASPPPAPAGATQEVDPAVLLPKLAELDQLLAMGQARARRINAELVALLADTPLHAPYQDIAAAIGRLDFPTAAARLRHFIQVGGWPWP